LGLSYPKSFSRKDVQLLEREAKQLTMTTGVTDGPTFSSAGIFDPNFLLTVSSSVVDTIWTSNGLPKNKAVENAAGEKFTYKKVMGSKAFQLSVSVSKYGVAWSKGFYTGRLRVILDSYEYGLGLGYWAAKDFPRLFADLHAVLIGNKKIYTSEDDAIRGSGYEVPKSW
jgi:hypothetical protein